MKEHIEQLRLLANCVPIETRGAVIAAIDLMTAANPLDDAAEREHCRDLAAAACAADDNLELVPWLLRQRAQARAEGYAQGASAGKALNPSEMADEVAVLEARLAAAQAEIKNQQEQVAEFQLLAHDLETKLTNLRAAAEQYRYQTQQGLASDAALRNLDRAIEASR